MTQTIRQATKADIPVIADHIKSLAAHHGDVYVADLDFLIHSFDLENSGITTFLGATETTPVSFAMVHPWARFHENACALNLHLFHVFPQFRSQGYGRQMIDHIKDWAQLRRMSALYVSADLQNEPTQQTYLKFGFTRITRGGAHFRMPLETPESP